jgi:hypothetical protein
MTMSDWLSPNPPRIADTLATIPQIRPTKIELKKYQFFLGKLISLANESVYL